MVSADLARVCAMAGAAAAVEVDEAGKGEHRASRR
jgi:hypothetical protein